MELKPPNNINYAATVVTIDNVYPLENCANIVGTKIYGNQIIIGKDTPIGTLGLFFPAECALSHDFLAANSLYVKPEYGNFDPEKRGFFEKNGRIRTMKLRGHKSEGLFLPIEALHYLRMFDKQGAELNPGDTFDTLFDQEICRKYVSRRNPGRSLGTGTKYKKAAAVGDSILPNQFQFHIDTKNLRRFIQDIEPYDQISITDKWHGTSVIIGNLLTERTPTLLDRIARFFGATIRNQQYSTVWASRRVIKGVGGTAKENSVHFYDSDVWGYWAKILESKIPAGYTLYGEIVGFTPAGSPIQGDYTYRCASGTSKFILYRVTHTTPAGDVIEFTYPQIQEFARRLDVRYPEPIYYGLASNYAYASVSMEDASSKQFEDLLLEKLERFVQGRQCLYNDKPLPAEGVVLRVEKLSECRSYKLKSFEFLKQESDSLDKGELDLESQEEEESYNDMSNL